MRTITQAQIDDLIKQAANSDRGRVPFNLHEHDEPVQRMINAIVPGSYVTPHKHQNPDKVELIAILRGSVACLRFTDTGQIEESYVLDESGPIKAVDIRPAIYHSLVALQPSAILEIIQGPYRPDTHKQFAPWAARENTREAHLYLKQLETYIRARR